MERWKRCCPGSILSSTKMAILICPNFMSIRQTFALPGRLQVPKKSLDGEPFDHALGVSRGGFGSKIHLACDKRGIPLAVKTTAGQVHDSTQLENGLEEIHIPQEWFCWRC